MDFKEFSLECWDWFTDETGLEQCDLSQPMSSSLEQIIASSESPSGQTARDMVKFYEENKDEPDFAKPDSLLISLNQVVTPKEKAYED